MVTERDMVRAAAFGNLALPVADLMSTPLITIPADATIKAAVSAMMAHGIRRLVVTDGERTVGILTERDLIMIFPSILSIYEEMRDVLIPRRFRPGRVST